MDVDPEIAFGIVGNIGQLWLKEQFTDLQINIDGCEFYCNRFILCACSEFFYVLLQSQVKGETAHHVRKVNIKGISPGIFQLVLNAIYKGENGLNTENMIEFWHAVHELQVPVLVSKCETFVSSHMTQENVLGIYTSALLLDSEKIVKMVHEFMAENYEYFSKCEIFFLFSSKTIHEILSGRTLKVDKQDNLPESIVKWVSHEPCGNIVGHSCAGDILEVPDTNIVSDQKFDHSTDVSNGHKGSVEVILQKPPAFSQDSCLQIVAQFLTETFAARKASLGSLLKLCRLSEASRDCLDMLADTDTIMGVKETRDIVRQALEAHSKARESVKNKVLPTNSVAATDDLSVNTEDVVVFREGNKMYAYSLDRNKFFHFMPCLSCRSVVNYYTLNNCIFITEKNFKEIKMTVYKFPFSQKNATVYRDVGSCSAIVGGFCYTFKDKGVYRTRCDAKDCKWFQVFDFKRKINCVLVDIFKDNIIFYDTESANNEIYCFDITTHKVGFIFIKMNNLVTFVRNDQLYVLENEGYLCNITTRVNPTNVRYARVTDRCNRLRLCRLFCGSCGLIGAVIRGNTLVIFTDLTNCQTPVVTLEHQIHGLSNIHFVQLNTQNKCYHLTVPSTMLITEV